MSFLPQKPMTFRIVRIAALSLGVLLLQSCSHLQKDLDEITQDDSEKKEEPGKADRFAFLKTETREISKVRGATESINEELVQTDADKELPSNLKSKTEKIPVTALAPKPETPKTPLHFYDDFVILNGDEEITVNLVFNSAPLLDVIPSFADALGFNFLADSDLKGVVTLNIDGRLRGCIGEILPMRPLVKAVAGRALDAAFRDPRFYPLREEEFGKITIEISVLTPPHHVNSWQEIEIGKHGILLQKGNAGAVFLPQVAPEQGWGLEETLVHLSMKAGLDPDAWKNGAEFDVFEAVVFHE